MKAILMSIKPQYVAKILNGEKVIEIRKKFPKDYVGWVYIYATKDSKYIYREFNGKYFKLICSTNTLKQEIEDKSTINGQVIARFWCDRVESAYNFYVEELCQLACISKEELYKYAGGWYKTDDLLAIHITKLEIFDEPKELWQFYGLKKPKSCNECPIGVPSTYCKTCKVPTRLTRAPQSWCYVEV